MLKWVAGILWFLLMMLAAITSSASINHGIPQMNAESVDDTGIPLEIAVTGSTALLSCFPPNDIGNITVSWIRSRDLFVTTVDHFSMDMRFIAERPDESKWVLKIENAQPSDSGEYVCQIKPRYQIFPKKHQPPREYPVNLLVRERVHILTDGDNDVITGSKITINCNAVKTSSFPGYRWYHNDILLSDGGRSVIKEMQDPLLGSQLTILSATPADAGKYTCKSTDSEEASVDITVTEAPPSLHVTGVTFSSVEVTWSYGDEEENANFHYVLRYRPDHSDEEYTEITDINTNSFNIDGLMPMTEYAFQVSAVKNTGERGPPSHTILVTMATLSYSLLRAVEKGHLSVVKDLLDLEADIDEGDGMYLKMASQMGHLEVVEFLLKDGADPDADEDGEAVQEAAKNNHKEVVRALLEAGADANVGDGIHYAVANNRPEIVKLLHQYGSDINKPLPEKPWKDTETGIKYGFGWTALHVAARWGKTSMVDLLYHLGSDLGFKDPNGDTPLHVAVKYPQIWFVRELLKYCPDLSIQNNDGKTVIDLVEDLPHAIYSSLNTKEGIKLRYLVANITLDKLKTNSNTEDAAAALEDEVEALVESNTTISDLVDAVASTDSHVDIVLQEVFEDTVYLEIEDAFGDHFCSEDRIGGKWNAALGLQYVVTCVCVPGEGPTLQFSSLPCT